MSSKSCHLYLSRHADRPCNQRTSICKAAGEQSHLARALQHQSQVHQLCKAHGLPAAAFSSVPAPATTFQLVLEALEESINQKLITAADAADLSPTLFLVLPRLALVRGALNVQLPKGPEAFKLPPDTFLPKICRTLPVESVQALRRLGAYDQMLMKRILAGLDSPKTPMHFDLYRSICTAADRISHGQGAQWANLVQRGACDLS